ncbi:GGDEF domain-containing protein [Exilibacterium tricleocarpae]|uniref:diguanylate cyclase n=1 Tax=Exilibacterium tricleocarpae TaxID=2591008 RepID=A0A545TFT5_9GAMM|nr:GGDEF domain-containing protein [Exilibacterium tricleocarpae]TQV76041.1 GGDEF domain-containing protein [Exilibacterium tricleocarpae]
MTILKPIGEERSLLWRCMDLKLLMFITSTVTLVIGLVLLITWQRNQRESEIALYWSVGFCITGVAWAMVILVPHPYSAFSTVLVSTGFLAAPMFILAGVFVRGGTAVPWRLMMVACGLCIFVQLWYTLVANSELVRVLNLTVFNLVFHLIAVYLCLRSTADRVGNIMLAMGSLSIAAVLVFRIYLIAKNTTGGLDAEALVRDEVLVFLFMPSAMVVEGLACLGAILLDLIGRLTYQASTDPMTGCLNRRGFEDAATNNIAIAKRHALPISAVICDIDYFKRINDHHGHSIGDDVIKAFAGVLKDSARDADIVGRMGGEEFLILLLGCSMNDGIEYAERIRRRLRDIHVPSLSRSINMTASFGVTEFLVDDESLESMFRRADRALYRAKDAGRDRVETCLSIRGDVVVPVV